MKSFQTGGTNDCLHLNHVCKPMCLPTVAKWCTLDKAAVFSKHIPLGKRQHLPHPIQMLLHAADILESDNGSIVTNVKASGSQMINSMLKWM